MMTWEQSVNRELGDLNDAHSAARIDTPEYRRRRRALLNEMLRQEGVVSHTLRRPAGSMQSRGGTASSRGPAARRPPHTPPRSRRRVWWALGVVALGGATATWLFMWPPF